MSAGDLPGRALPGPTPGRGGRPPSPGAAALPAAAPPPAEVDDALAALAALPQDAPVLDQATLLEQVQERLARLLTGADR